MARMEFYILSFTRSLRILLSQLPFLVQTSSISSEEILSFMPKASKLSHLLWRGKWKDPPKQSFTVKTLENFTTHTEKKVRRLLSPRHTGKHLSTRSSPRSQELKSTMLLWRTCSPECLLDSTNPQINDLQQIITGTGQKLCSLRVQIQSCDSSKQLQFFYYALSPNDNKKRREEKIKKNRPGPRSQTTESKLWLASMWKKRKSITG